MRRRIDALVLALASLVLALPAVAEDAPALALPDSPVGLRAQAFLDAFQSGDRARLIAFIDEHCAPSVTDRMTPEQLATQVFSIRAATGALELHSIKEETPLVLTVLVKFANTDTWGDYHCAIEKTEPHKLVAFTLTPAQAPGIADRTYDEWTDFADLLTQASEDGKFPAAAMAMIDGDEIVESAVVGVRRTDSNTPALQDDRFHIGSVTKSVTATMIARLVEADEIEWDVTIAEALPDVEMLDDYRNVTLLQLVQHRGGIQPHKHYGADDMNRLASLPGTTTQQRAAYVAEVLMEAPIAAPGTAMHYSNAGYTVAAFMAERATNKSWEALLQERVFEPLDMESAGFGWPAVAPNTEQPYGHAEGRVVTVEEYELGSFLAPAGDVHCSIEDLARYARFHLRGLAGDEGALKAETVRFLHQTPDTDGESNYACGWVLVEDDDGAPLHWHNGSAGTFYALVAIAPKRDRAVVFCTNVANGATEPIAWKVVNAAMKRRE